MRYWCTMYTPRRVAPRRSRKCIGTCVRRVKVGPRKGRQAEWETRGVGGAKVESDRWSAIKARRGSANHTRPKNTFELPPTPCVHGRAGRSGNESSIKPRYQFDIGRFFTTAENKELWFFDSSSSPDSFFFLSLGTSTRSGGKRALELTRVH